MGKFDCIWNIKETHVTGSKLHCYIFYKYLSHSWLTTYFISIVLNICFIHFV